MGAWSPLTFVNMTRRDKTHTSAQQKFPDRVEGSQGPGEESSPLTRRSPSAAGRRHLATVWGRAGSGACECPGPGPTRHGLLPQVPGDRDLDPLHRDGSALVQPGSWVCARLVGAVLQVSIVPCPVC